MIVIPVEFQEMLREYDSYEILIPVKFWFLRNIIMPTNHYNDPEEYWFLWCFTVRTPLMIYFLPGSKNIYSLTVVLVDYQFGPVW